MADKRRLHIRRDQRCASFVQVLHLREGVPGHFSKLPQPPFHHVPPCPVASEHETTASQHKAHTHLFVVFLPFVKDT